eukprot:469441-Lingulodinium_polyedra.AAC.1
MSPLKSPAPATHLPQPPTQPPSVLPPLHQRAPCFLELTLVLARSDPGNDNRKERLQGLLQS